MTITAINCLDYRSFDDLVGEAKRVAKEIRSITISDLILKPEECNGLYFVFREDGALAYIGKSEKRAFVERVAAHFDMRKRAYMNGILKGLVKVRKCGFDEAVHESLGYRIALIPVCNRSMIKSLENLLIRSCDPELNAHRKSDKGLSCNTIKSLVENNRLVCLR